MDPLSVGASIIAVAGALYNVSQKLRSCARTLVHAGKEVKALAKEINIFSTLMRSLRSILERLSSLTPREPKLVNLSEDLVKQAEENVGEFNELLKTLKPLCVPRDGSVIVKTLARLRWAFQKSDLLLLRSKLDSSKVTLTLYLTMIQASFAVEELAEEKKKRRRDKTKIEDLQCQV